MLVLLVAKLSIVSMLAERREASGFSTLGLRI
jgi:hypothetical protein